MSLTPSGLFVTGTDTEVGKTYVAALIARALVCQGVQVGVYKPVASGCRWGESGELVSDDAVQLWEAAGRPDTLNDVCPQRFAAPLAPHVAAAQEGRAVDESLLVDGLQRWSEHEFVIVEGAGGLMSPLSTRWDNLDVAQQLGLPLLIVAANRLGVLNHTRLTLAVAASRGLSVTGVILNDVQAVTDASGQTNLAELRRCCDVSLLAHVTHEQSAAPVVDWQGTLGIERT